jgi:DNA-binding NarL/FixJ family response regulator
MDYVPPVRPTEFTPRLLVAQLPLTGLRILLVEDEMLVSLLIEELLVDQQATVVGPYCRFDTALAAAKAEQFDFAVLDVNLAGKKASQSQT